MEFLVDIFTHLCARGSFAGFNGNQGFFAVAFVFGDGSLSQSFFALKNAKTGGLGSNQTIFIYTSWRSRIDRYNGRMRN